MKKDKHVLNLVDDYRFNQRLLEKWTAKILIVCTYSKSSWKFSLVCNFFFVLMYFLIYHINFLSEKKPDFPLTALYSWLAASWVVSSIASYILSSFSKPGRAHAITFKASWFQRHPRNWVRCQRCQCIAVLGILVLLTEKDATRKNHQTWSSLH